MAAQKKYPDELRERAVTSLRRRGNCQRREPPGSSWLSGCAVSDGPVSDRQARLLAIVAEGGGDWDARRIDLTVSVRFGPGEGTVLQELQALQRLGLADRDVSRSGVGGRWAVTAAARAHIAIVGGADKGGP